MTIEEYLKISAEEIENTIPKGDNCDGNIYLAGKVDAYREILSKLPEMEHEVTLKEVKELCQAHFGKGKCGKCPMGKPVGSFNCIIYGVPAGWEPDEIEKRMKEANRCRH